VTPDDNPVIVIGDPERDRYARLRLMEGYRQEIIERARMMVVGAGALGNEVLKNLALLGVGHLFVVDFDTIEASNLTRSILYRLDDQGRSKADVAAERVRQINPDVNIIPWKGDITHDVGLGVFARMDVVLGCLDNREARMAVNRACWRVGVPWIDGALNVGDGSVRVFIPRSGGACYECLMTKQDYALANIRYACPPGSIMEGVAITTPMSASIIGAMQVQEAR
jgi:molybdopterin/thiamine biosynthesis adenylyltransferase